MSPNLQKKFKMEAPTSYGDAGLPESIRQKLNEPKPILEALNEDGSIDIELLKQISQECLIELNKRHDKLECK